MPFWVPQSDKNIEWTVKETLGESQVGLVLYLLRSVSIGPSLALAWWDRWTVGFRACLHSSDEIIVLAKETFENEGIVEYHFPTFPAILRF